MSIDLDSKLVETATKVVTTENEFGDTVYGNTTSSPCLYRDISMTSNSRNREDVKLDGILWFGGSESVVRGDIYYHPQEGYLRIELINKARRRLVDNSLKFIKCGVSKQRQVS